MSACPYWTSFVTVTSDAGASAKRNCWACRDGAMAPAATHARLVMRGVESWPILRPRSVNRYASGTEGVRSGRVPRRRDDLSSAFCKPNVPTSLVDENCEPRDLPARVSLELDGPREPHRSAEIIPPESREPDRAMPAMPHHEAAVIRLHAVHGRELLARVLTRERGELRARERRGLRELCVLTATVGEFSELAGLAPSGTS